MTERGGRRGAATVAALLSLRCLWADDTVSAINSQLGSRYPYVMAESVVSTGILGDCRVYVVPATESLDLRTDRIVAYGGRFYPVYGNFSVRYAIAPAALMQTLNDLLGV